MKKVFSLFCTILFSAFSCEKDTINVCSVDPVEDLSWLQSRIRLLEQSSLENYSYVQQAELLQETVFIFGNCCPFCLSVRPVYNCQGK